jgi:hypothetical protein
VKRVLYVCAFACLVGACYYALQLVTMPNLMGEAIAAVDSHDRGAAGDVDAARAQMPEAEGFLKDGGLFLLGFGASILIARRVR